MHLLLCAFWSEQTELKIEGNGIANMHRQWARQPANQAVIQPRTDCSQPIQSDHTKYNHKVSHTRHTTLLAIICARLTIKPRRTRGIETKSIERKRFSIHKRNWSNSVYAGLLGMVLCVHTRYRLAMNGHHNSINSQLPSTTTTEHSETKKQNEKAKETK